MKQVHEGRRYRISVLEFRQQDLPLKPIAGDFRVTYEGTVRNVRDDGSFDLERDDDHTLVEGLSIHDPGLWIVEEL